MSTIDSIPVQNPGIVSRILENEAVLVMPQRGKIKVLNEVGARIWELADGKRTLRDIIAILANEFDIAGKTAEEDILEFIKELQSRRMIQLIPSAA